MKNNWISVSKKLPEYGKRVLCYGKISGDEMAVAECLFTGNDFLHEFLWNGEKSVYVSHWQPLPLPPKKYRYEIW